MRWDPIGEDAIFQLHSVSKQIKDAYYYLDDAVWRKRPNSIKEIVGRTYTLYSSMVSQIIRKRGEIERDRDNDGQT